MANINYTKIFNENVKSVYRYVYSQLTNKELAEDITSEVFRRLVEKKDIKQNLVKYWLFAVAHNLIIDHYRRHKEIVTNYEILESQDLDPKVDLESSVVKEELVETLETYLQRLNPMYREAITLKTWEGLTFREIGDVSGITEDAAKKRYYRGVELLESLVTSKDPAKLRQNVMLGLSGVAALGAYLPASQFITTFISANLITMSATAASSGIAGFLAANKLILAGTTVAVAGTATLSAVVLPYVDLPLINRNQNQTTQSSSSRSQTTVSQASSSQSATTSTGPRTYTSNPHYAIDTEAFTVQLPAGWSVSEAKDEYSVDMTFSKGTFSFNIRQNGFLLAGDPTGCYFSGENSITPYQYANFFDRQRFISVAGGKTRFAVASAKDQSIVTENYGIDEEGKLILIPYSEWSKQVTDPKTFNTFNLCTYQTDKYGFSVTPYGTFTEITYDGGYEGPLFKEFEAILNSMEPQDGKFDAELSKYVMSPVEESVE